jgi:dipeptidyl aminopeptidase/acylaminoacyl peptidase
MFKTFAPALAGLALAGVASAAADAQAAHPQFSPDGSQLAYFTFDLEAGEASILIRDMASGETRTLETGLAWSVNPVWAPDGESLAFTGADGMRGVWDIYSVSAEGGEARALTQTPEREFHPHLSPDGERLVFIRMEGGSEVWLMEMASGETRALTDTPHGEFHPKWSADGRSVLFDRGVEDGGSQIIELDVETGEETLRAGVSSDIRRVGLPSAFGEGGWMYASNFPEQGGWAAYADGVSRAFSPEDGSRVGGSSLRPGTSQIALELDDGNGSRLVIYDYVAETVEPLE